MDEDNSQDRSAENNSVQSHVDDIGRRVNHAIKSMKDLGVTPRHTQSRIPSDVAATIASYEHPESHIGIAVNGNTVKEARTIPSGARTYAEAHGHTYKTPSLEDLQDWNDNTTYKTRENTKIIGKAILDESNTYEQPTNQDSPEHSDRTDWPQYLLN